MSCRRQPLHNGILCLAHREHSVVGEGDTVKTHSLITEYTLNRESMGVVASTSYTTPPPHTHTHTLTSCGTTTSSKETPTVLDALCPIIHSLGPGVNPAESASTMNPVKACPAGTPGSAVLASTKYLWGGEHMKYQKYWSVGVYPRTS